MSVLQSYSFELHLSFSFIIHSDLKIPKPEPGEVSPLHSSTSSKKDDSLKRDRERESQDLNDSEEEGDLLEDEDEVSIGHYWFGSLFLDLEGF